MLMPVQRCSLLDGCDLDSPTVATAWLKTNLLPGSHVRTTPAPLNVASNGPTASKDLLAHGPRLSEGL